MTLIGEVPARAACRQCLSCKAKHYPMWVVDRDHPSARWLHTAPSSIDVVFVSLELGVDVSLLKQFEAFWVNDGITFDAFAAAYNDLR